MIPDIDVPDDWSFGDLCTWMYCVVDDAWQQLAPSFRRPGPAPVCSDSELLAMCLIGECIGWDVEMELLSEWGRSDSEVLPFFPRVPSQSRFNRRRRALMQGLNLVRKVVLASLDVAADRQTCIDSLPIPVVNCYYAPNPHAASEWKSRGASFGRVASKRKVIFGYKLHMLVTLGGVILDFEMAPANFTDLAVGQELLERHCDLDTVADKGYISEPVAQALMQGNNICLMTVPRTNQKRQLPPEVARRLNGIRQIIETVNAQLQEQFNIERNHAHTFWGLCARLYSKLAAHTLCLFINRALGKQHFLQIKQLAFPI